MSVHNIRYNKKAGEHYAKKKTIQKDDVIEDILQDKSAYGEFVSTFHAWTGLRNSQTGRRTSGKGKQKTENRKTLDSINTKEE